MSYEEWCNKNLNSKLILDSKIDIDNLRIQQIDYTKHIIQEIEKIILKIQEKLDTPNKDDIFLQVDNKFEYPIKEILSDNIPMLITYHNQQQTQYQSLIDTNIKKIKQHFIAKDKDRYNEIHQRINSLNNRITCIDKCIAQREKQIDKIDEEIKKLDSFDRLNSDLNEWFYNDIRFEKISDSHYKTQRKDCDGKWIDCKNNLSEGEKTIVSVIYFINRYLASLESLQECPILIIDDPITSLDSQNKDKIINYITNKIIHDDRIRGQLFILSHDKNVLIKINKCLKQKEKNKTIIIKIEKNNYISMIQKLQELKNSNEAQEIYKKLKSYVENQKEYLESSIKDLPRNLLEKVFAIVFDDDSDFTKCYNDFLKNIDIEQKYTAGDIQTLNHNKEDEDLEPEIKNKCKFVIEIFEKFIRYKT
ncbi:AAA family ATPase [Helicobacter didelphidarum]|uniref:AAA family ATPase n=1 Tax=Helicobacter didelphidarum TaxID=2040648 RepID=UPI0024829510|nr:AAA family ATPase [Helicobacter didelphidarum]